MRCCFINYNLDGGGAERHLLQLIHSASPGNWQAEVVLLERCGVWLSQTPASTAVHSLSEEIPRGVIARLVWGILALIRLRSLLKAGQYDVLITFLWLPTLLVAIASVLLPGPRPLLIWSVQSDLAQDWQLHPDGWLRLLLVRLFVPHRVHHYIAVSRGIKEKVQHLIGGKDTQWSIIPNSIDLTSIMHKAQQGDYPPGIRSHLISVGRLHPLKGMDILLKAVALVVYQYPSVTCTIVGQGREQQALQQLAQSLGIQHHIHFTGFVTNPYSQIINAEIFVSASRRESFGIAIAEAMSLGRPVIATATDGACDLIEDGVNGLLVPIDNPEALASAIVHLLTSPDWQRQLAAHARITAQHYDVLHIGAAYTDLFYRLLDRIPERAYANLSTEQQN